MTDEEIIEDILDEFDFYKVEKAMAALNWTWAGQGYPTIGEMRKTARGLMRDLIKMKDGAVSTGGFLARKQTFEEEPFYELSFVLTSWDNHG